MVEESHKGFEDCLERHVLTEFKHDKFLPLDTCMRHVISKKKGSIFSAQGACQVFKTKPFGTLEVGSTGLECVYVRENSTGVPVHGGQLPCGR